MRQAVTPVMRHKLKLQCRYSLKQAVMLQWVWSVTGCDASARRGGGDKLWHKWRATSCDNQRLESRQDRQPVTPVLVQSSKACFYCCVTSCDSRTAQAACDTRAGVQAVTLAHGESPETSCDASTSKWRQASRPHLAGEMCFKAGSLS